MNEGLELLENVQRKKYNNLTVGTMLTVTATKKTSKIISVDYVASHNCLRIVMQDGSQAGARQINDAIKSGMIVVKGA